MSESRRTRILRFRLNHFPAYRRTGARIAYIRHDMKEVRVKLPLNRRTRNLLGTTFGGSMYAAVDPVYMVMFLQLLGGEFIVWDKAATIDFRKPGRSTLHAHFLITDEELEAVRSVTAEQGKTTRTYPVALVDAEGEVCAAFEKVLYFRRK